MEGTRKDGGETKNKTSQDMLEECYFQERIKYQAYFEAFVATNIRTGDPGCFPRPPFTSLRNTLQPLDAANSAQERERTCEL